MEMDIKDFVTEKCLWSEVMKDPRGLIICCVQVGKTEDGNLFILVGTSRIEYTGIATYSPEELKMLTVHVII